MKIILIIIVIILECLSCFSHEQDLSPVHQRIVWEAYQLLKMQFSQPLGFADMSSYLGEINTYRNKHWIEIGSIIGGSDHEDREDIVFHKRGYNVSSTHFWVCDDLKNNVIKLYPFGWFRTAYSKACSYMWDDYIKVLKYEIDDGNSHTISAFYTQEANSYLSDWYFKDRMWILNYYVYNVTYDNYTEGEHDFYSICGNEICKKIFYNILGRLCHLLTDMGVPEHARQSIHVFEHTSPFEHWLRDNYWDEFYWTAEKVYEERGGFVNPFCPTTSGKSDAPYNLFYTLAQISDWFSKYGGFPRPGNDVFNTGIGEIESIINSYAPLNDRNEYQAQTQLYETPRLLDHVARDINLVHGRYMRDVLLPYTIRAVAGMLYKYIIETRMQFPNATNERMGMIFDQQQELKLFKQYINGDYYTFRAEGDPGLITVCPVENPDDFTIGPNALNVTFRAAKEINFKSGFSALSGSQVHAYICPDCSRTNRNGNCHECGDEDKNPQYDRSN